MDSVSRQLLFGGSKSGPSGQQEYTTPGTYSWVAPAGVTSVSVVCVGPGGTSYGGSLGYKNNYAVTPGNSYTVVVGAGGASTDSYFVSTAVVKGGHGNTTPSYAGDGGGNGGFSQGNASQGGGGGAGGYSGNGGAGADNSGSGNTSGSGGTGGGGGGGGATDDGSGTAVGAGGGGVGILGQGTSGTGGGSGAGGGGGGSGGLAGLGWEAENGRGGAYGGSSGFNWVSGARGPHGVGAVRIIWPGSTRQFPSTNTGNV